MVRHRFARHALLLAAACLPLPAAAQNAPEAGLDEDAIVVTAQRSGAPMWTIDTPRGTIIVVGEIAAVPKSTPWQPDRLEEATRQAGRVILRSRARFSPGDALRLIFAGGDILRLPDKSVAADYLDTAQRQRLAALEEAHDVDYDRRSFLITSFDLLARRLDFDDDTTRDASDVVQRAADRADVPTERIESFRGEDLLDDLAAADPRSHIPCLEAAMTATEIGPELIGKRGDDWRKYDVPAVMANPLEVALGRCWPWADAEIGEQLRDLWTDAITQSVASDGVTLAVVPLRVLAEPGGVLDMLEARGLDVAGPDWR